MILLPTTVVGSYPQPDWLVDREKLASRVPPRVRAREFWRVPEPFLQEAQDDVGYCVFGKVIDGQDVVDKIKAVRTANKGGHGDVPVQDVVINSVRRA